MVRIFCYLIFSMLFFPALSQKKQTPVYKNANASITDRISDLLSRMTLEEKVAQMQCIWSQRKSLIMNTNGEFDESKARINFKHGLGEVGRPSESLGKEYISKSLGPRETALLCNKIQKYFVEKTRLGIPVMFHEESLHGNAAKDATHFPSHLGLASSWNESLLTKIYTCVAEEVRVRGAQHVLAPVVDLGLDPRWGRTEETLGEDPYLVSRLAVAEIKGYQGKGPLIDSKHVIATLKHFGVHGMPEGGLNVAPSFVDERTLRQVFFPSFKACVEAGVLSVMPTYNEISGIPSHANKWLLTEILRNEWKFKGVVISDYHGIKELHSLHNIASDSLHAAKLALEAGVDLEAPYDFAYSELVAMAGKKTIDPALIDSAVSRILYLKFISGLFENPYTDPVLAEKIIGSEENRKLALQAAHESIVLLKNEGNLLPLDISKYKKIAVIGPNADRCILGGYSGTPKHAISPLQGMKEKYGNKIKIEYSEGVRITDVGDWFNDTVVLSKREENFERIKKAVDVANQSDIVLLFVGGNEATAREGWAKNHLGDNANLELIGEQNELIKSLHATGKPVVAFISSGPPLSFQYLNETVPAIVQCWYLGQETGYAIANILTGEKNPSGKLPITIPRSSGHIPSYYFSKPSARRGYMFEDISPLYPFGFGLSYTSFEISNLRLSQKTIGATDSLKVYVTVKNTGKSEGEEVVQLYIRDEISSVTRPIKELKGFQKVKLLPGESKNIVFHLGPESFKFLDINMKWVVEPGTFNIMVGNSSENLSRIDLEVINN